MRDEERQPTTDDVTQIESVTYRPVSRPPRRALGRQLHSSVDVHAQLVSLRKADREHFVVFDLDVRHRIIARRVVHIGTLSGVEVHPREVFRDAVVNCAAALILSHNHPSGDPSPSRQDIELTARLRQVGELLGITILDHVIVAADGFVSLAERGWL
jgi:DNA repair protein RadC